MGTRLRPLTDNIPKCLVPIHGQPLLGYWLDMLAEARIRSLVNLHYRADQVRHFVAQSRFKDDVTMVYEDGLLGTAGTLLKNRAFFGDGRVMLVHADNLSRFDMKEFIRRHEHRPKGCVMTMMTYVTPTPESCGIVELDGDGVVTAFHEKVKDPPGNLSNGAVYILEPTIFDFLDGLGQQQIDFSTEVLPRYMGKIFTFHNDVYHRDIGTMESYEAAEKEFLIK